jgi:hypothetical protein
MEDDEYQSTESSDRDEKPFQDSYESMDAARIAIKDVLHVRGLPFYSRKSSRFHWTLGCPKLKWDPPVECDFIVTANYQKRSGRVRIIKCRLDHTCGCMLEGTKNLRVKTDWVYRQSNKLLQEAPSSTPADIVQDMRKRFGVVVSYKMAWKVKQNFQLALSTNEDLAFQLIQPFFAKLEQRMPGTLTVFERDDDKRLLRTFVLLKPLADALKSCKPMLSLDACELRSTYKGVIMVATMMDGAGQMLPLAWGTAQIEDSDNWNWFAQKLSQGLPYLQEHAFTIFSDLGKGIEDVVERHFPKSYHSYCVKHIEKILFTQFKYQSDLVMKASKAIDYAKFDQAMAGIQNENKRVHTYLLQIPQERWTTCHATHPKWGHVTLNAFETLTSWVDNFRDISHIGLHSGMALKCTQLLYERRTLYNSMTNSFLRPVLQQLESSMRAGQTLHAIPSSESLFTVGDREVDLTVPSCTCKSYSQTRLPCKHIAAVGGDITQWVHPSYNITSLKAAYAGIIPPVAVDDSVQPDNETLPPVIPRQVGRPKRLRNRSDKPPEQSPIVCSKCGQRGHNARTCERRNPQPS